MLADLALQAVLLAWIGCVVLVVSGAAIQVAAGAGLSVVCGTPLILLLGPSVGIPVLLCLNLLVSIVATACGFAGVRWADAALASGATLAGCGIAWSLPPISDVVLKVMTACMLVVIALPRPPVPEDRPSALSVRIGVALASLASGALTVWTATPGPIVPVAFARAGLSGADIRRTMQPISVVGYGVALACVGAVPVISAGTALLAWLVGATIVGTALGFLLRSVIAPARVVLLIRSIAAVAALLLLVSVLM